MRGCPRVFQSALSEPQGGVQDPRTRTCCRPRSPTLSLKQLSGGGLWGGDTLSSLGFLEEPRKSSVFSGSNHRRSGGGAVSSLPKEGLLSQGGRQILLPLRSQLVPHLEFPEPGGDQSLPLPPQFSLPVTWDLRSLFFSASHMEGKWCT